VRLIDAVLRGHLPREADASDAEPENATQRLRDLCREAGWTVRERAPHELVIDLETARGFHQAELAVTGRGSTRITAVVARFESLGDVSRDALAHFLLAAGRVLRLVRPVINNTEDGATVAFEFETVLPLSGDELDDVLTALAVAAQEFGREIVCLGDEASARRYLSLRGGSPRRANRSPQRASRSSEPKRRVS